MGDNRVNEYLIHTVVTLLVFLAGFFVGRLPIDTKLKLPKRKSKPKAVTVTDRKGQEIKVEDKLVNPLEKAFDDHEKNI